MCERGTAVADLVCIMCTRSHAKRGAIAVLRSSAATFGPISGLRAPGSETGYLIRFNLSCD